MLILLTKKSYFPNLYSFQGTRFCLFDYFFLIYIHLYFFTLHVWIYFALFLSHWVKHVFLAFLGTVNIVIYGCCFLLFMTCTFKGVNFSLKVTLSTTPWVLF